MQIIMVKYDGISGHVWCPRNLTRTSANRLMSKLEKAGKRPVLVVARVKAEHIVDIASTVFASPCEVSHRENLG